MDLVIDWRSFSFMTKAYSFIKELIRKGEKIRCSRTGRYDHKSNMNPDGKGGYVIKQHDIFVRENQRSKYQKGKNWQRGFR